MPLKRSFTGSIILLFIVSALVLAVTYYFVARNSINQYSVQDPIVDLLTEEPNRLALGEYEKITDKDLNGVNFMVFDDAGNQRYATDKRIAQEFAYDDTEYLPNYLGGDVFYHVFETKGDKRRYLVIRGETNYDSARDYLIDFCWLDSDYDVLAGDLFKDEQVTAQDLKRMEGVFSGGSVAKSEVETENGEITVVWVYKDVLVASEVPLWRYSLAWWPFLLVTVAVIVLWTIFLRRTVRKNLSPLDVAVTSFGRGERVKIVPGEVPTEFVPLAERFNEMADRLESANEEKDRIYQERQMLMADISHDLKTPLTVIQGYAQAFLDGKVPPEKEQEYLAAIYEKAGQSTDMINRLLEYTRLEAPTFETDLVPLDVAEFTRAYLAEKHEELRLSGIELVVEIPESAMYAMADEDLLTRLFDNLISNSVKYGQGAPIYCSMNAGASEISLLFADDGPGIPAALRTHIFTPFVIGSEARSSGGGTGLGMAIAKKIVERHEGTIRLMESTETSHATAILITFPKADPH